MPVVAGMSRQVQENLQGEGNKVFFERFDFYPVRREKWKGKGER